MFKKTENKSNTLLNWLLNIFRYIHLASVLLGLCQSTKPSCLLQVKIWLKQKLKTALQCVMHVTSPHGQ